MIMFHFTFLLRLLYFWETCNSFSHAIRYSIEEAIRLRLIKPRSNAITDIPPTMQDPNYWILILSFTTITGSILIALLLIIILIFKTSLLRKRNFTNIKQY